jgi:hypothetical protein
MQARQVVKRHASAIFSPMTAPVPTEEKKGWVPEAVCILKEEKNLFPLIEFKPQFI